MTLIFKRKQFEEDCKSIANIIYEHPYGRVQKYISNFFNWDLDYLYNIGKQEGHSFISDHLMNEYAQSESTINQRLLHISNIWNEMEADVFTILTTTLDVSIDKRKPMVGELSINVVCPRYLDTWTFDINYRKSDEEIILTCIHEIIHFIWFEKWLQIFPDTTTEAFHAPHTVWLLSEITIDAIIKETGLSKYCSTPKPAYDYFYDIMINEQNMMEYFRELFRNNDIKTFMNEGLNFVMHNRELIPN